MPPGMGFYLIEQTYDPTVAWQGLEDGHVAISVQHPGYWTRAGHYIVLQEITEDGMVRVRDSNIYNYRRISNHINDEHTWGSITSARAMASLCCSPPDISWGWRFILLSRPTNSST